MAFLGTAYVAARNGRARGGRPLTLVAHDMGAPRHPHCCGPPRTPGRDRGAFLHGGAGDAARCARENYRVHTRDDEERIDVVVDSAVGARRAGALDCGKRTGVPELVLRRCEWKAGAIEPSAVDEYLRTFSGTEGVLGALGVYRAAFQTMNQTTSLVRNKVRVPLVALGGEKAQGERVREMVALVANAPTSLSSTVSYGAS